MGLSLVATFETGSNNEIGILYEALLAAEKDSVYYMSNYKKAEDEIHTLGNLALRDAMTNVGNKAAFTQSVSELQEGDSYAIALMDANNLKMINDTYGHVAGDGYIKGCCRILCDVFKHSPVFRIGGDEFAVILKGHDYENRSALVDEIRALFQRLWAEREGDPVHRYSGSIGMADSAAGKSMRETIQAADDNMYEDKRAFKKENGSYR